MTTVVGIAPRSRGTSLMLALRGSFEIAIAIAVSCALMVGNLTSLLAAIRAYVAAVQAIVANETASISAEEMQRWSKWALAEADRVDPVRSARFIDTFDENDDAN